MSGTGGGFVLTAESDFPLGAKMGRSCDLEGSADLVGLCLLGWRKILGERDSVAAANLSDL